jgi:drug/metabolite transporter (DMT)-like permease
MTAGMVFSAVALGTSQVTTVEPLLATNVGFAVIIARCMSHEPLGRSGWAGVAALAVGVVGFLAAARPHPAGPASPSAQTLVLGLAATAAAAVLIAALHLSRHRALMLATASGVLYGLQDTITHQAAKTLDQEGLVHLAANWEPYALVATGATALVLSQMAFKEGTLKTCLPALTTAEPLTGIACAIGATGEAVQHTGLALACEVTSLLSVVVGLMLTSRRHGDLHAGGASTPPGRSPATQSGAGSWAPDPTEVEQGGRRIPALGGGCGWQELTVDLAGEAADDLAF